MSEGLKRKLILLASLLVAGGAMSFLLWGNVGDNLVYYWNPTELLEKSAQAQGAVVRLGGMVEEDSVHFDEDTHILTFVVSDGDTSVKVRSQGVPPDMFRAGIGAVVEGHLGDDGVFEADKLIVKHSNEYKAPEEMEGHTQDPFESVEGFDDGSAQ